MLAFARRSALVCVCVMVAACHGGGGGGGGSPPPPATTFTVGGTVSGLAGSGLVLQNNAGNNLSVATSGAFTFSTALASGAAYSVTVLTQPTTPSQTCTVTGGSGTISANVTAPQIACTTNTFAVGVTITGFDANGLGLVLQNNAGNDLTISANGNFNFSTQLSSGAAYAVTVKTQPNVGPFQVCSVTNGTGAVGNAAANVAVACTLRFFKFLYLPGPTANVIGAYAINASNGHLTAVPGQPFAAGGVAPQFAVPHPGGKFLIVSNKGDVVTRPTISVYAVDAASGALTENADSPYDYHSTQPPTPGAVIALPAQIHPSGSFGYIVANSAPFSSLNRLYGGTINSTTGALTEIPGFPLTLGASITSTAFDSAGKFEFVVVNNSPSGGEIRSFQITAPSGVLTPIGTFPAGDSALGVVLTPGDDYLLTLNSGSGTLMVFAVNKTVGTLSPITSPAVPTGPAGSRPSLISFNRRNSTFYVANTQPSSMATFRFDLATGIPTMVGTPVSANGADRGGFIHTSGRFYYQYNVSTSAIQRFAIDQTTGALTLVADVTTLPGSPGIAAVAGPDPSGKYVYVGNGAAATLSSYSVDAATGALTLVDTKPGPAGGFGMGPFAFQ
jgi:hypothetical protein